MDNKKTTAAELIPGRTFYRQDNPRLYRTVGQVYYEDRKMVRYTDQGGKQGLCTLDTFLEWVNRGT